MKNKSIFIVCLGIVGILSIYFTNEIFQKKQIEHNKKRLIELAISREKMFWNCFNKKVELLTQEWSNSDEYIEQNEKYEKCQQYKRDKGEYTFGCMYLLPKRSWQEHNEIASKYCSDEADNSDDGRLKDEFRKKVPISEMTDNELNEIVKSKILK
jgi:hypothetical protein